MGAAAVLDPLTIAEDAWAYMPPMRPDEITEDHGDVVLDHIPMAYRLAGGAYRVRFEPSETDRRVEFVRDWMAGRGRDEFVWQIGASTSPRNLEARLVGDGARIDAEDPVLTPMVLDREPPPAPSGVEVRLVLTLEEYTCGYEIQAEVAGYSQEDREYGRAHTRENWAHARNDRNLRYLAFIDGVPVACGFLARLVTGPPYLAGASTLPWARGRGAYRALVRARWDAAVAMGTPALIIQAGKNSRPILERLGFRSGPPIHVVVDRARADGV